MRGSRRVPTTVSSGERVRRVIGATRAHTRRYFVPFLRLTQLTLIFLVPEM